MTEEKIFQKVYNVYLNYERELANGGMEDVQSIASHLTMAYMMQLVALPVSERKSLTEIE